VSSCGGFVSYQNYYDYDYDYDYGLGPCFMWNLNLKIHIPEIIFKDHLTVKILITGTAGFIGFHLANRMILEGHEVVGLDNINDYYDVGVKYGRLSHAGLVKEDISYGSLLQSKKFSNYRFIKLDLENQEALASLFLQEKFDAVCNLAAQAGVRYSLTNPHAYIQSNVVGFLNILECCREFGVDNLSYASSSSVYGLNESYPFATTDSADHPMSLYAASKKSNELMAHTYSHLFGIRTTGLRFFTVYGPWGRPDMALFLFTKAALEGEPITVFNHGEMLRDFTYVDDIVDGIKRVIDSPASVDGKWQGNKPLPNSSSAPYRLFNIGNNSPVKLMDFIQAIENSLDISIEKNMMPIQPGDVPQTFANVDDLIETLGYAPETSFQDGITKFVEWYLDFFGIDKERTENDE
jgi:UDP-glucuronate 4-epimerase